MKKVLSFILVVMMSAMVCSCSNEEADRMAVENTVKSFMDTLMEFKFDELAKYVVDKDELPEEITGLDLTAVFNEAMDELPAEFEGYVGEFEKIFSGVMDLLKDKVGYEIKAIEKGDDKGKYSVTLDLTVPEVADVDFENILTEGMNEEQLTGMLMEMFEAGTITENTSEQEMMDLIMPKVIEIMNNSIKNMTFESSTEEIEFDVVKENGEWLIDAE